VSFAGDPGGLEQLESLRASGLVDAKSLEMIEASMTNASEQLEQLHASGVMSDEIYAQAKASMSAAMSGGTNSVDAAELDLLQRGTPATATVLALREPNEGAGAHPQATLEVHPATGSPYTVECAMKPNPLQAEPKVGDFIRVVVDPREPKRVAIDQAGG
jgi:hypothetical protein